MFRSSFTHSNSGKLWLDSPEYGICDIGKYDLIWFDLIWIDIPNLTENNIHYGSGPFYWSANLQATRTFSFSFSFSRFRRSCSRKCHSKKIRLFVRLDKTAFLSLAERRKEMWFEWKWKWCFRSSIIRNRFFWRTFIWVLSYCCIWKYVMIIYISFHFSF